MATYTGTEGNDSHRGTAGDDTIDGRGGDDILVGALGNDTIFGGTGNDRIEGSEGDDTLYGGDGSDRLRGGVGADWMDGGAGDDVIVSPTVGDHVDGGDGDDLIDLQTTADVFGGILDGGAGFDTLHFVGAFFTAATGRVALSNFEHIAPGSLLHATNGQDSVLDLSRLVAPSLATDLLTIIGGTGADRIRGGAERDYITGESGDDALNGGGGDDLLNGGRGNDALNGGDGIDTIQLGSDTGDPRGWTVSLTRGLAVANGESDRLSAIENVNGGGHADVIAGSSVANRLYGYAGDDRLSGADGDDILNGGSGYDILTGGAGADIFDATERDDGSIKGDAIQDFSQADGDRIDLELDADPGRPGFQPLTFIGQAAFSGSTGQVRFSITNDNTFISADLNGDAQADYVVRLKGAVALSMADLILAPEAAPIHDALAQWSMLAAGPLIHLA